MNKEFMRTTDERLNRLEDWAQQMGPPYLPPFDKPVGKPIGTEDEKPYHMLYRNHRGEVEARHVYPLAVWYGVTEWHDMPQWFLRAWCLDRKAARDFAMNDILGG